MEVCNVSIFPLNRVHFKPVRIHRQKHKYRFLLCEISQKLWQNILCLDLITHSKKLIEKISFQGLYFNTFLIFSSYTLLSFFCHPFPSRIISHLNLFRLWLGPGDITIASTTHTHTHTLMVVVHSICIDRRPFSFSGSGQIRATGATITFFHSFFLPLSFYHLPTFFL